MFVREDWMLFRSLATLGQKAGVAEKRLPSLALKELADNALDAGANCTVDQITSCSYRITDNGPGIPGTDAEVAALFSIKRPLTSSKLLRLPTRGALGNGLRVVAGLVLASEGSLTITTNGRTLRLMPQGDGTTKFEHVRTSTHKGTIIDIAFGPLLSLSSDEAKQSMWMARYAIISRGNSAYAGLTSAHWYDPAAMNDLFEAAGDMKVSALLLYFDGGTALMKREWVAHMGMRKASMLTKADIERLWTELRNNKAAPAPTKLGVVGPQAWSMPGYACKRATFSPRRGAEIPAVVEVWARKLEAGDTPDVTIFINRTPIASVTRTGTGKPGTQWITGAGLNHYFKTGRSPMRICICVTTPYMPITNDGKEPDLTPLMSPLIDAIASACRKAKAASANATRPDEPQQSRKEVIFELLPEAMRTASGNGSHRFSLRQLFYAIRPLLLDRDMLGDAKNAYKYFCNVVGEYEANEGHDVKGMYRDPRGALQHPHEGGAQMALGTLNVEKYKRPAYKFNKVLYIEKGGFLPLLNDVQWGERHDCAILTSQGFASRAARDILDLMGDTDEDLEFFCIHDGDGPGTGIYEALVEGTKARPGRRVKVTNLGLDPWEAEAMGLQHEEFERQGGGKVPVAQYVKDYDWRHDTEWEDWLQTKRTELNAMSSPQFLAWLDGKMVEHAIRDKVVPPDHVLEEQFAKDVHAFIRAELIERLIREHKVDERAKALTLRAVPPPDLEGAIRGVIEPAKPTRWNTVLQDIAADAGRMVLALTETP